MKPTRAYHLLPARSHKCRTLNKPLTLTLLCATLASWMLPLLLLYIMYNTWNPACPDAHGKSHPRCRSPPKRPHLMTDVDGALHTLISNGSRLQAGRRAHSSGLHAHAGAPPTPHSAPSQGPPIAQPRMQRSCSGARSTAGQSRTELGHHNQ